MAVVLRQFGCGRCRKQCFACGPCDKNRAYCELCGPIRRAETARRARRAHQKSEDGKADHRDRQRAYRAQKRAERLHMAAMSQERTAFSAAQSVMDLSAEKLPSGFRCASPPARADSALESLVGSDGVTSAQSNHSISASADANSHCDVGAKSGDGTPDKPAARIVLSRSTRAKTVMPTFCCTFCGRQGQWVRPDAFRGARRARSDPGLGLSFQRRR